MISYKNTLQINPRHHYLNIDFNVIKNSFTHEVIDYGSILAIVFKSYFFTIDRIGQIIIHYNEIDSKEIQVIVNSIDELFLKYNYPMDYNYEMSIH